MTAKEHLRVAGLIGICLAGAAAASSRAAADDGAVARLTQALAAGEAGDGRTSPYLLPVLEELAQAQRLNGALGEAVALRRRALDIAIAAFGCDSASAAQAMAALALVDIERRRYLDAEPLLIVAERILRDRVAADHPAMATIFAGLARIALARGDTKPAARLGRQRALDIARRNPHGRSAEPLRALGAVLAAEERFEEAEQVLTEALGARPQTPWRGRGRHRAQPVAARQFVFAPGPAPVTRCRSLKRPSRSIRRGSGRPIR